MTRNAADGAVGDPCQPEPPIAEPGGVTVEAAPK